MVAGMSLGSFSRRHGYAGQSAEITIREDAPDNLRAFVVRTAGKLGLQPDPFRDIVCEVLEVRPDPSNWSPYPNIADEVERLVRGCEWFLVYDIVEEIWSAFKTRDEDAFPAEEEKAPKFREAVNDFFVRKGIGWQLADGRIVTRGAESFEKTVKETNVELIEAGRPTAAKHMHEALQALSRRPDPDLAGAAFHAMGSLECVARDVTGDPKATFGEIVKKHPGLVPRPLDEALSKLWGYASNETRHVVEGREAKRDEVELMIGMAAAAATYLSRKFYKPDIKTASV
jgi:hypothetical protein